MNLLVGLRENLMQSPMMLRGRDFYEGLSVRDQWAVKILVGFLLLVLVIFGLLMPVTDFMQRSMDRHRQALEDYQWIAANRAALQSLTARDVEAGQSLFGLANTTAKSFQISFKRYEPVGDNALSLWLEGISFNQLVLWLERLDKRYGVRVREIAVERQPAEGLVNVRLVLQG